MTRKVTPTGILVTDGDVEWKQLPTPTSLHELEKEIQAIEAMETRIWKETPKIDEETKETLRILNKAKVGLEVLWWRKAREYADNYGN
jgi:hypothetical protein